jgi:hypothetical protein
MNLKGHEILQAVLLSDERTCQGAIHPKPKEGMDSRGVDISGNKLERSAVLEVLGRAGLLSISEEAHLDPNAPILAWTGTVSPSQNRAELTHRFVDIKLQA